MKSVYTVVALVGIGLMITGVAVMSQESKPEPGGAPATASSKAPSATDKPADKPQEATAEKPADENAAKPAEAGEKSETPADPNAPAMGDEKPWSLDELEQVPITPLTPGEAMESVNLNNVEMRMILQKLGEWTGKPIIPSNDEVMRQRITIFASQQLPRSSALSLVYAALRSRGIIAEHYEDKIILKPIAQARQGYIPTVSASEPLVKFADKSQIVEKFFRLQSYSPTRLVEVISPLIAEYGHVTALENTRDIVVIDTVENLIRIEQIIKQLDVPESSKVVEQVFEVKNTDPGEIVQVLELILTDLKGTSRTRGNRSGMSGGQPQTSESSRPQQAAQRSGQQGANANPAPSVTIPSDTVPIKLIAMPKQSWIIARGTNEDIDLVAEWIKKLDIPESVPTGQTVVPVKFVDAREVANIIQNALQDMPGDVRANIVVQALNQSKQVVVFGSEENRKMVERLIAEVDLPSLNIYSQRTFTLKHADPDQIKTNIDTLFDGSSSSSSRNMGFSSFGYGGYGRSSITPDQVVKTISYPTLKQVTVIASEENIKKIAELIEKQWDVPLDITKDQYRILTLKNSDPVQMTTLLTTLFSAESSGSSNSNLVRMIFGSGSGMEDEKKKIVGSLYGMLTFESVPGTKKIIVISKIPEAYDVIAKLVMDLDREEKAEVPTVITLKYADAEDLCEQLNAMLNEAGTTATIRRGSRGLTTSTATNAQGGTSSISSGQETNAEMITPWWNRSRTTTTEEMPTSNLIGQVRFVPVHRSKAIMILSPPEYLEDLKQLITDLDKPGMQVMVKVVIVEVNLKKATSIGVQLSSNPNAFGTLGVNAVSALTSLSGGSTGRNYTMTGGSSSVNGVVPPAVTAPTGSTQGIGSVTSADINVLVDLLVEHANGRVLNQPTLWTKDNEEATFIKGEKIAFTGGTVNTTTGSTQSINYEDVGLTLKIRPNITPEKAVDMTVYLNISQLELSSSSSAGNTQPRKNLDTTTHMIIGDGQSIMLGGILFQNDEETQQKVPLLGDIPLLGELFKHKKTVVNNSELLVFVTPYVMDDRKLNTIPQDSDQTPLEDSQAKLKTTLERLSETLDEALGKPYEPVERKPGNTPADDAAGKTHGEKADDAAKDKAPLTTDKTVGPTAKK